MSDELTVVVPDFEVASALGEGVGRQRHAACAVGRRREQRRGRVRLGERVDVSGLTEKSELVREIEKLILESRIAAAPAPAAPPPKPKPTPPKPAPPKPAPPTAAATRVRKAVEEL
ncbi:MAG: hypothetical protein VXY81_15120, partial [Pseudomonadota bacterium]|nr:hypothetical protein [Pseudomonadota bacterium]